MVQVLNICGMLLLAVLMGCLPKDSAEIEQAQSTEPSQEAQDKECADDFQLQDSESQSEEGETEKKNSLEGFRVDPYLTNYSQARKITWNGDILPFLENNQLRREYNCVTCHTDYKMIDTLQKEGEIERMKKSMRASGGKFMPRIGDKVPDTYLVMFDRWSSEFSFAKGTQSDYDAGKKREIQIKEEIEAAVQKILDANQENSSDVTQTKCKPSQNRVGG
jgi:hypothetical protein